MLKTSCLSFSFAVEFCVAGVTVFLINGDDDNLITDVTVCEHFVIVI